MVGALTPASASGPERRVMAMVGFMGAGKSTAAVSAARALGTEAVDVDQVIEQRSGKPIAADLRRRRRAGVPGASRSAITLELLDEPAPSAGAVAGRRCARLRARSGRRCARTSCRGSTSTSRPPGPLPGHRASAGRDRTAFARLLRRPRAGLRGAADVVVPARTRSGRWRRCSPRWRAAAGGGITVLWATSASGDYPGVHRAGPARPSRAFWPRDRAGPAVRRHRLATPARLYGDRLEPARRARSRSCPASSRRRSPTPRSSGRSWRGAG